MIDLLMLAPALVAVDIGGLIKGLIYLLLAALVVCIFCYIVARLASQFAPGVAPFVWIIWAIGGLILLLIAFNIFSPMLI